MNRPGYTNVTDALLSTIANRTLPNITAVHDTFVYNEASALEQEIEVVLLATPTHVNAIWIDMVNVTQDSAIRVYHKIDGTNYRLFQENNWVVADDDGILIDGFLAYDDVRLTIQCAGGGIGNVNVPYGIV